MNQGSTAGASPSEFPAAAALDRTLLPDRRLRWAMHGALLVIALVLAAAGWTAWRGERQRSTDAELINLAGAQRMLSQRVALLAIQRTTDNNHDFQLTLDRAQREAARIEHLLGLRDTQQAAALPAPLTQAVRQWQQACERLWSLAHGWARMADAGATAPNVVLTTVPLRIEADTALRAAQTLVAEIQRHADAKATAAMQRLAFFAAFGTALLIALALGVVEPAARFVRRQHQRLAGQAAQLERLALVAEHTHNLVIVTDVARRVVWVNPAFTRFSGHSLDEAMGRNPAELLQSPTTDQATLLRMRLAMNAGQGVRAELLSRSHDGRDCWLDIDIQPLHDAHGTLSGFIAVEADITAQVMQRERLRTLFDALPAGVVEQDASGAIVDANRAAEQVLGLTREQLLGRLSVDDRWRTVREDLSPYPGEDYAIARSLRDGVSVRADSMGLLTPQGEQRWLFINSDPLRDTAGEVTGAVACFIDVTEQRNQRILLHLALKAADIGTWQWHVDNDDRQWNAASCGMLGYSVEEFKPLLSTWRDRIHSEDRPHFQAVLGAHLEDPRTPYRCEVRVRHRAGHWVWVHIVGAVVEQDHAGKMRRMVGVQIDISERKRQEQQLQLSATTDSLTGLPNRAALVRRLQETIGHWHADPQRHFALLFLDFDRFKQVNDTLGHAAGDELLRQIAARLQGTLRPGDAVGRVGAEHTAARLGGDEFVVLLEGLQHPVEADASAVADRLLQVLARPYEVNGHRVHSSASIGVVTSERPFENADSLLRDADTAMYEGKQNGRGRWVMFEPHMHEQVSRRATVEADLRLALERDELFVVYQPVVSLDDPLCERGAFGVEALVRWRHPVRGIVPPVQFITVAEESGLIGALGQFVLQTACRQFMRWRLDLGDQAPTLLAVNLSVAQLRQFDLVEQVEQTLQACSMPAAALQLEVTESLAAQDPLVQGRLRDLKALGVKLALDDFGTGYSSLACLHQLPVDTVKIDRSFIVEAERSEYHRALIEATVRVARTLRMSTVAEGIETTGQADLIASLGCDRGQGYLYSKPLETDALTRWITSRAPQDNVITLPFKPRSVMVGSV